MSEPTRNFIAMPTAAAEKAMHDRLIRDYLASPAAEKALAEALLDVQLDPPDEDSPQAEARAILAAWVASLEKAK